VDINGSEKTFFFGCSAGDKSPVPGVSPEGFGAARVVSITVVFDEGTDTGPDFSGMIILDNLDVNAVVIGDSGSTET
jgi:hypothetical protein